MEGERGTVVAVRIHFGRPLLHTHAGYLVVILWRFIADLFDLSWVHIIDLLGGGRAAPLPSQRKQIRLTGPDSRCVF